MKKRKNILILLIILASLIALGEALTQTTKLISVAPDGVTPADGYCNSPNFSSADGRYVAFQSNATNLTPNADGENHIFLFDRLTTTMEIIDVVDGTADTIGSGGADWPSISADGQYVAFHSTDDSLNIIDGGPNCDVFVRDRNTNTTELISVTPIGEQCCYDGAKNPSISADGRYVAFQYPGDDLVNVVDFNYDYDIFVRDRNTDTTELVSYDKGNTATVFYCGCQYPSISANGRWVAFASDGPAGDYVNGIFDPNGDYDVFLRDIQNDVTYPVSVSYLNTSNMGYCGASNYPSVSADGSYVAYYSEAPDLADGDLNGVKPDYFLYSRATGTNSLISVNPSGGSMPGGTAYVSYLGDIVGYGSDIPLIQPKSPPLGNNIGISQVFMRDVIEAETTMLSISNEDPPEAGNDSSDWPSVCGDGSMVVFRSGATNLLDENVGEGLQSAAPITQIYLSTIAAPPPEIISVDPDNGPDTGGTDVEITGKNFQNGATVKFDNSFATGVVFVDPTLLRCVTPAHAVGMVAVTVTNPDTQFDILQAGYTYTCPPPAAPSDMDAEQENYHNVRLTWKDNSNDEDGFIVERLDQFNQWAQIADLAPDSTNYLDQNLNPDCYDYRVYAYITQCGNSGYVRSRQCTRNAPAQEGSGAMIIPGFGGIPGDYNYPPSPMPGDDSQGTVGNEVNLDGSNSWDQDDDPLTFSWEITQAPDGSTAELTGADTANPSFTPDVCGTYVITLSVSDGMHTRSREVTITVPCDVQGATLNDDEEIEAATDDDSDSEGGCFVATAAFGSTDNAVVMTYISLRDNFLLNTSLGKTFVGLYYRLSPPAATIISKSGSLRAAVRAMLAPITPVFLSTLLIVGWGIYRNRIREAQ